MRIHLEHSEAEGRFSLRIVYGGAPYDPLKDSDELSQILIRHLTASAEYRYDGQNLLTARF